MEYMKIVALALCGAVCALVLRRLRPEASSVLVIAAGVLALLLALPSLSELLGGLSALEESGGVSGIYMTQLMKVAGISLLMDFAAQTCRDAGEESLAMKTELAGRIMLLSLALPFMQSLLSQVLSLSP